MAFGDRAELLLVHWVNWPFCHLLEQLSGPAGSVQEQHAPRLSPGALPGMWHVARDESAGSWPSDCDRVSDLEGDLAAQDIRDLVTVVMQVHRRQGANWRHLLEHHHALIGIAVPQFKRGGPAGR